jgi:hypothetical protein
MKGSQYFRKFIACHYGFKQYNGLRRICNPAANNNSNKIHSKIPQDYKSSGAGEKHKTEM